MNLFHLHEIEEVIVTSTHQVIHADITSAGQGFDDRFRLQSLLGYKYFGVSLGYEWGLTNLDGQNRPNKCHSRYANIGILYGISNKFDVNII
jgi:hypothetical protein